MANSDKIILWGFATVFGAMFGWGLDMGKPWTAQAFMLFMFMVICAFTLWASGWKERL